MTTQRDAGEAAVEDQDGRHGVDVIQDVGIERGGPKAPVVAAPARRRGSVRRTSTIDSARPDGLDGDVVVLARSRDLRTTVDGRAVALGAAGFDAVIARDRTLRGFEHPDPRLATLVGGSVASGFRARALDAVPDEAERRSLLNLLLDDLPGASLVAGFALQHDASWLARRVPIELLAGSTDQCAGWAAEATILDTVRTYESIPVPTSPRVPDEPEDADAWHERPMLPAGATRRARRLDVVADRAGAQDASDASDASTLHFDAHFRDSYRDADGEGALHEYSLRGRFDPATRTIVSLDATAHVLPWTECPQAVASARRIVGTTADDLRSRVRTDLTGTSTCTHLNDMLRSLADLPVLAAGLARSSGSSHA